MKANDQVYGSIKSDLLDLSMNVMQNLENNEFISQLEELFKTQFNVTKIEFFLYEDNRFRSASSFQKDGKRDGVGVIETIAPPMATNVSEEAEEQLDFADDTLMIRNEKREPVAMILVKSTEAWHSFAASGYFREFQLLLGRLIETLTKMQALQIESVNYQRLLEATKTFNSTMETGIIHERLVSTVAKTLAPLQVELILSKEQLDLSCAYRLFDYANELPSTAEAFLSGELTIGLDEKKNTKVLSSPVKGMQGTYGILQLSAPADYMFTHMQKEFVTNISDSAGHAIENSSLYDQSHRLVSELQLVNEVSKKLTGRLSFEDMISYIHKRLSETFHPEEVAFVHFQESGAPILSKETTSFFFTQQGSRYLEYATDCVMKKQDAVFIADLDPCEIEGFSPYRSMIIAPINISEVLSGYTLLMHTAKYHFSFEDFKLVKAMMSHSSLALSNSALREKLQELANKDQLTGLYARGYLDRHMAASFEDERGGAFILLDVDDFKQVNDQYGHAVGDQVLQQTAELLKSNTREQDIAGRWGGEEFAVYLPGATLSNGKQLAERLLKKLPEVTNPPITVSIGVSVWEPSTDKETYQQLFQQTDEALYKAKKAGKNQIVVCESILAE